jgi:hypothetical protein
VKKAIIVTAVASFVVGCAVAPDSGDVKDEAREPATGQVSQRLYSNDCEPGYRLFNCSACGSWMCVSYDTHGECDGYYWLGGGNACSLPYQNPNPSCCYMM